MNATTTDGASNVTSDIERLKTVLNHNPDDIAAVVSLGNIYYDQGEAAQAIIYYSYALRIDPNLPDVWTDMGTMYWRNGDVAFAERAYRQVLKTHAGFGNAYINLGLLLRDAKRNLGQACALWKELVERYPNHPSTPRARALLAETFLQLG
jgi:tetratricopeptide (TPR) repeat protein